VERLVIDRESGRSISKSARAATAEAALKQAATSVLNPVPTGRLIRIN
jgi:hypothetical protein